MLGYVRNEAGEMLGKHHALYRATYCGLCRSVKKNTTRFLLPFFSDDWVFLALLRLAVSNEKIQTEKDFCLLHPFRKNARRLAECKELHYASEVSLIFTYEKMMDELLDRDTPFFRRAGVRFFLPFLKRKIKALMSASQEFAVLFDEISKTLSEGRRLEQEKADLDAMCANFAACLSTAFSFALEGDEKRLLAAIGDRMGRFLYTLDALDDLEKDASSGAFNPILLSYSSVDKARRHFAELDLVLAFYVQEMKLSLDLISGDPNFLAVAENVICHGLPRAVQKIIKPKMGEEK